MVGIFVEVKCLKLFVYACLNYLFNIGPFHKLYLFIEFFLHLEEVSLVLLALEVQFVIQSLALVNQRVLILALKLADLVAKGLDLGLNICFRSRILHCMSILEFLLAFCQFNCFNLCIYSMQHSSK